MNGTPYLRRDLRAIWRSRSGLALIGLFGLLAVGAVGVALTTGSLAPFFGVSFAVVTFVFSGIGLVLGTFSVATHRESGSLRFLFTLPGRRARVVVAAFLARALVVVGGFVGLVVVTAVVGVVTGADWGTTAGVLALGVFPTLAFLSVGIAISTLSTTQRRGVVAAVATYAGLGVGWHALFPWSPDRVLRLVAAGLGIDLSTGATQAVLLLAPGNGYFVTTLWPFPSFLSAVVDAFGAPAPSPATAFVVLLAWIVLPVSLAAWRIERVDVH